VNPCPFCAESIPAGTATCPHCHSVLSEAGGPQSPPDYPAHPHPAPKKSGVPVLVVVLVLTLVGGVLVTGCLAAMLLPALTRAGIAHLYFESIHPFEDGNGRIGRAIAEKAIAQSLSRPVLTGLATAMLARRRAYYRALEAGSRSLEITPWLEWFADTALEAQRRTASLVEFLVAKARLLERLREQLNPRQEEALLRMLREGPSGFHGGLSAGNYMTITGASPATATRDLADLVDKRALVRTGERRHARYRVALAEETRRS